MKNSYIFNATVCIFGILMLGIHTLSIILKKKKRKDEMHLLECHILAMVLSLLFTLHFI